jgi:hypothetical protein
MSDKPRQLDLWYQEHERIRRWYVRTMREMTRKLARIRAGETVYPDSRCLHRKRSLDTR